MESLDDNVEVSNELKARPYQDQLIELALVQNSIIYLPTGSGKTFIAMMVMKHLSAPLNKYNLTSISFPQSI